jgi:hypothetical protein
MIYHENGRIDFTFESTLREWLSKHIPTADIVPCRTGWRAFDGANSPLVAEWENGRGGWAIFRALAAEARYRRFRRSGQHRRNLTLA